MWHAGILDLWMAEAVLSAAGRLRGHVPGAAGRDGVGELRREERQSAVRELHGALGPRGERGGLQLRVDQGICDDCGEVHVQADVFRRGRDEDAERVEARGAWTAGAD